MTFTHKSSLNKLIVIILVELSKFYKILPKKEFEPSCLKLFDHNFDEQNNFSRFIKTSPNLVLRFTKLGAIK